MVQVHLGPPRRDPGTAGVSGVTGSDLPVRARQGSTRLETQEPAEGGTPVKKLLVLAAVAAIGYVVYRQIAASKAEQDLWTEATSAPDLR